TAVKIRDLLEKSLPAEAQLKIIPCEYNQLRNAESIKENFPEYEIVGIIGTNNPSSNDLPYISLEELIAGKGITTLLEWTKRELTKDMLSYVTHEFIRNFSLDQVIQSLTILDTEKIIRQLEVFLIQLEERW
ncbi:sigma 54-interacting transcriptional regulator, partial [Enterococcus faecium]